MRQFIPVFRYIQLMLDLVVTQVCLYGISYWKFQGAPPEIYKTLSIISTLLIVVIYQWQRVYQSFRADTSWRQIFLLLRAWGNVLLGLVVLGIATKTSIMYSREVFFYWAMVGAAAQLAAHLAVDYAIQWFRSKGINRRRAIFVGEFTPASEFAKQLKDHHWLGIDIIGYVSTSSKSGKKAKGEILVNLGHVDDLPEIIRKTQSNLIYFTLSVKDTLLIEDLMRRVAESPVDIHWVPDLSAMDLLNQGGYFLEGQPVICLTDSPLSGIGRLIKWTEDIVLSTVILLLFSPLLVMIAVAIKLTSRGPILFIQKRAGLNGRPIYMYKFRSMKMHEELDDSITPAVPGEPRLTLVGGFLRKTSLDEFPQFINVLQGRMSIVGPRPHALAHESELAAQVRAYMMRYRVKPGITGWAQVNGWRGLIDSSDKIQMRVKYDMYYINNWSLTFDIFIILRTILHLFSSKNAH